MNNKVLINKKSTIPDTKEDSEYNPSVSESFARFDGANKGSSFSEITASNTNFSKEGDDNMIFSTNEEPLKIIDKKLLVILEKIFCLQENEIDLSLTQKDIPKWDSLTYMDLITTIEKEYQIDLEMVDILKMNSIKGIIQILDNYKVIGYLHE